MKKNWKNCFESDSNNIVPFCRFHYSYESLTYSQIIRPINKYSFNNFNSLGIGKYNGPLELNLYQNIQSRNILLVQLSLFRVKIIIRTNSTTITYIYNIKKQVIRLDQINDKFHMIVDGEISENILPEPSSGTIPINKILCFLFNLLLAKYSPDQYKHNREPFLSAHTKHLFLLP